MAHSGRLATANGARPSYSGGLSFIAAGPAPDPVASGRRNRAGRRRQMVNPPSTDRTAPVV
jgi:hypothetical protein